MMSQSHSHSHKVSQECPGHCGVRIDGEVDLESREFIHRFRMPVMTEEFARTTRTEIEGIRLVTFAPAPAEWFVDCPQCRRRIAIPATPD